MVRQTGTKSCAASSSCSIPHWPREAPPAGIDAEISLRQPGAEDDEPESHRGACDSYALWAALTGADAGDQAARQGLPGIESYAGRSDQPSAGRSPRGVCRTRAQPAARSRTPLPQGGAERVDRLARPARPRTRIGAGARTGSSQSAQPGWMVAARFQSADGPRRRNRGGVDHEDTNWASNGWIRRWKSSTRGRFAARAAIFDPRRMNAIDSEESAAVPEGTVLEVYRSGYEWNGEVFRPAQVKVSRAPAAGKEHE